MTNSQAWNYAIGIIKVDGLEPTKEFREYVEKEKRGEVKMDDIKKFLDNKYKVKQEWAGQQRKLNIYKEEPVLGGLSIDYSDLFDIQQDAESILYEMRHKKWNFFDILESAVELLNP